MDVKNFLQRVLISKQMQGNTFGSLTLGDNNFLNKYQSVSLFSSANAEDIQNLDWTTILGALSAEQTGEIDPEMLAAMSGEQVPVDASGLTDVVQTLMGMEEVQAAMDFDGDGVVSEEEAVQFFQEMMSADGDKNTLTYDDIDKAFEKMGIDFNATAEESVEEALKELDGLNLGELTGTDAATPANVQSESPVNKTNAPRNTDRTGGGAGSYTPNVAKKSASDELEELEKQRNEIVTDADNNINQKETEKDKAVAEDKTINSELKTEYQEARTALQETNSNISQTEANIHDLSSKLSGIDNDLSALKSEQGSLRTDTNDEKINQQNQERLNSIKSSISQKETEKADIEKQKGDAEEKLKGLEDKRTNQEKSVALVEAKIAQASPELAATINKINGEIQTLKTQKTTDLAEIDGKIETKRAEAKEEASKAGESKGKAANNIGSALIDMASKYMGLNEGDGSYKMFTNGRTEAWCADFMSYVVKEFASEQGLELKDGFGSSAVSTVMQWAKDNGIYNDIANMSSQQKQDFLETELQPGDIIIWKRNGMSHTGFIKEIGENGDIITLEGNSNDEVRSNVYNINNNKLSGFIKLSDVMK